MSDEDAAAADELHHLMRVLFDAGERLALARGHKPATFADAMKDEELSAFLEAMAREAIATVKRSIAIECKRRSKDARQQANGKDRDESLIWGGQAAAYKITAAWLCSGVLDE